MNPDVGIFGMGDGPLKGGWTCLAAICLLICCATWVAAFTARGGEPAPGRFCSSCTGRTDTGF